MDIAGIAQGTVLCVPSTNEQLQRGQENRPLVPAWGAVGGMLSFGVADVGGKACKTLAQNLALKGKDLAIQVASDVATATIINAGTWLNGSKMKMLYKRLG